MQQAYPGFPRMSRAIPGEEFGDRALDFAGAQFGSGPAYIYSVSLPQFENVSTLGALAENK
jgi:hypothetical protein